MSSGKRMRTSGDRKGNMPFAMIAVTLLVLAGAYGIVAAGIERTQNNMESMQDELDSVGNAMNEVKERTERGIGEVILNMGREASTGTLDERFDRFDKLMDEWMRFQFPMRAAGAVVTVNSYNIELDVGTLKAVSEQEYSTGEAVPSCFRADGNLTVNIVTSSGSTVKEMAVSADSMSALPMILTNATEFEYAVTGPWSLITELMTYQLSSLAQYRVMSGYGAMSEYGEKGTNTIITQADVELAYRIALSVAEVTYLRTTSDDEFSVDRYDNVDVAELIAFRNGIVEIDMGAVMAQTLAGIADDLLIGWMDYFMLFKLLDIIETVKDTLKNAWNWLCKVFTGSESETAQGYLSATMANHGIPESEYRYLLNGVKGTIGVPQVSYDPGEGDGMIEIPERTVTFDYPSVDVLKWSGWNGFMSRYRADHNEIRESIRGIINSIAIGIAGTYNMGTVRVMCDPFDQKDFMTTLTEAVAEALDKQRAATEDMMESTIRDGKVIDALYATIYKQMSEDRDSLFGITALKNNIRNAVKAYVTSVIEEEHGIPLDPSVIDSIVGEMMLSGDVADVTENYGMLVNDRMSLFEGILNSIEKSTKSVFKDVAVILMRYGFDRLGIYPLIAEKMKMLVRETAEIASISPLAGVYELPGKDSFVLEGNDGTVVKEYITAERTVSLNIRIQPPTESNENIHYVGFREDREASYSSMFRIFVTADLSYRAESASSLMRMLGSYDAAVSGNSHSEFDIAVAVMSGWALAGVHYEPSTTIIDDLIAAFLKIVEPLLEPLFQLIKLAKSVLNVMTNAIMRVAQFAGEVLMKLYDIMMVPIELMGKVISGILEKIFDNVLTDIILKLGSQTFGINIFGLRIEIITNLVDEIMKGASTTTLKLTLPIFGVTLSASIEIKKDKDKNFFFSAGISAEAETWNLHVRIDPLMKVRKYLAEINGTFRGTDMHAVTPEIVQYDELEFRLSDIPGVSSILSNIPLPIPGMKGSIDAGFELKYNMPYVYGVVINEFELNPRGTDSGNEWVELYNSTVSRVDLEGYMLTTLTSPGRIYTIHGITLNPGERTVITFPGQFLNNSKEAVILMDPQGREVDATPLKNDAKDDDTTWQRETDASAKWVFKKGTKGADNGGTFGNVSLGGNPIRAAIMQCVQDAAIKAFAEVGMAIIGPDGIAHFLKRVIEITIDNAINMIASCVVSASVFIEIAVMDATGSASAGIRLSLVLDGDIVRDGLNWAVGQIKAMMNNIDNPTGMTPRQIISDDIYFQTMLFARVTTPKILGPALGDREGVTAGLVIGCNITALCNLIGRPGGSWKVYVGLVLEDIPAFMVPGAFTIDSTKKTDLWLFRMTLERAKE